MGFIYENSNQDRFQQFCQSLIISERPHLQCYPVGQPDGGRDAFDPQTRTVLQMKFKRADEGEDNSEWLISVLEGELDKIRRLIEWGATEYLIVTNARGTSHYRSGRMDKVQSWLDENIQIPAQCYWRDDLDRRFERAPNVLKLRYSEMLTLEDGIDVVLDSVLKKSREPNQTTLRTFLNWQYSRDAKVKFKQVHLSNNLLDLFIDVPVRLSGRGTPDDPRKGGSNIREFMRAQRWSSRGRFLGASNRDELFFERYPAVSAAPSPVGAGELLIDAATQEHLKLVVLEGAPGQGKSTLAQFICQIHRARYLKRNDTLESVPEHFLQTPFRVPIKVDLRDFAAFLEGESPYEDAYPTKVRSLEGFLAQLIVYGSGGLDFSVDGVHFLLKETPVLLFLDGLDEVGDVEKRNELVESLMETLNRINEDGSDIQVVVTSRPSIFGKAPAFDRLGFQTLRLGAIDSARIFEYTTKWVTARGLEEDEREEVKRILEQKLELAHIRDLTRNPMQLTILLSLIHQVGHSLPDQRTDLYQRYVELFLTREADKSSSVREHRPILLGFIQHLAWILQSQAESARSSGNISAPALEEMAREYLISGGHSAALADDLFSGGLERVFVLVERIQGLYEFEVQPLREFFCAQYLYETAPVGTYRDSTPPGDRAQRFEALAANPFWLNVTRFYAGCYTSGEIGTLVVSLEELVTTRDTVVALQARRVGLALLQDWVLSNKKFAQAKLVNVVFDELGVVALITADPRSRNEEILLDPECGQADLRAILTVYLKRASDASGASAICRALRANGGKALRDEFLDIIDGTNGSDRTLRLRRMFQSGAAESVTPDECLRLLTLDSPDRIELTNRAYAGLLFEPKVILGSTELVQTIVDSTLDGLLRNVAWDISSELSAFSGILDPCLGTNLGFHFIRFFGAEQPSFDRLAIKSPPQIEQFVGELQVHFSSYIDPFTPSSRLFTIWNDIAEATRSHFGERWAASSIAIRAAGLVAKLDIPRNAKDMFDTEVAICLRARAARLWRGGSSWWRTQLDRASTDGDRMLWAGLALAWSSPTNLYDLSDLLSTVIDDLTDEEFFVLRSTMRGVADQGSQRSDRRRHAVFGLDVFSNRTAVLLGEGLGVESGRLAPSLQQINTPPFRDWWLELRQYEQLEQIPSWKDEPELTRWLDMYAAAQASSSRIPATAHRALHQKRPSLRLAELVLENVPRYPSDVIRNAQAVLQSRFRASPVGATAEADGWIF